MEYVHIMLLVCSVACITQTDSAAVLVERTMVPSTSEVRQYVDSSYPLYAHRLARRFDLQFQPADLYQADYAADSMTVRKRNNAEVVHHILKNFGGIDRLSEVGKK
ncbi:CBN-NLP-37 protein [Aphelenchoides avenae]|nr:CBN-NLP-37 protein [Aphelenchus avenae]KAH7728067.1 CBN-NLP-37 protein [Aphelenchus avenae]